MKLEDFNITNGLNSHQTAVLERNDKTIDYTSSKLLSYKDILSLSKGLDVISEFFDVNAVVTTSGTSILATALGKTLEDAMLKAMDGNPVDFINSAVIVSTEVDSDAAKMLKSSNIVAAPRFTKNAIDYLESHEICYVTINTPLKDYKKYLSDEIRITPFGTLTQSPNLSELNKDTFKVVSKLKPTVEQIEDAVFAWKIVKHAQSNAIVIAKDLKTSAISQGLQSATAEYAMNYSCDMSKDAILASDIPLALHDINAAAQGRIGLIIIPEISPDLLKAADKFNIAVITTGIFNLLY